MDAGAWYAPLVEELPKGLRAQHPEDLHITLAFLGDCTPATLRRAWALVRTRPPPRGHLHLTRPAAFGGGRALGFDLRNPDPLCAWTRWYRAASTAATEVSREMRPPRPHLTVAWASHRRLADDPLARAFARMGMSADRRIPVETVTLCCRAETSGRAAPRYRTIERLTLPA